MVFRLTFSSLQSRGLIRFAHLRPFKSWSEYATGMFRLLFRVITIIFVFLAEREGFEPPKQVLARLLDFESSAFSLSAISPKHFYYIN